MYRSIEQIENLKKKGLEFSTLIAIPSYKRHNAKFFRSPIITDLQKHGVNLKETIFLFTRNDPEEINGYKHFEDAGYCTIVPLDGVTELGGTRKKIIEYFNAKNVNRLIMLDDVIDGMMISEPQKTSSGSICMKDTKRYDSYEMLCLWEWLHNEYHDETDPEGVKGCTLSAVPLISVAFSDTFINRTYCINNGVSFSSAVMLSLDDLREHNINYEPVPEAGTEDIRICYEVMKAGLIYRTFSDIPIRYHREGVVGGNVTLDGVTPSIEDKGKRYKKYQRWFIEKTLKKGFYDDLSDVGFVRIYGAENEPKKKNIIRFNWKYWQRYYKNFHHINEYEDW